MEEQLKALLGKLNNGADIVSGELPEYCKEYVNYIFYTNVIVCSLFVAVLFATWVLVWYIRRLLVADSLKNPEAAKENNQIIVGVYLIGGVFSFLVLIFSSFNFDYLIKSCVAPRVLIVEHLTRLIN